MLLRSQVSLPFEAKKSVVRVSVKMFTGDPWGDRSRYVVRRRNTSGGFRLRSRSGRSAGRSGRSAGGAGGRGGAMGRVSRSISGGRPGVASLSYAAYARGN